MSVLVCKGKTKNNQKYASVLAMWMVVALNKPLKQHVIKSVHEPASELIILVY